MTNMTTKKQQLDALIDIFYPLSLGTRIEDHLWDYFVDEDELPLSQDKFELLHTALKEAATNWGE